MKQSEVNQLSDAEILEQIQIQTEKYGNMRVTHTISQLENPMDLRYARRTIARLKTELRKRQVQGEA
jgi:large subunit ribosomal protein L29